jgi:hypothetical protein
MGSKAIEAIAEYRNDVERSLRLYFREVSPSFSELFLGTPPHEVRAAWDKVLADRLEETDRWSAFFILASLEKTFRDDYRLRCKKRARDGLSKVFRDLWKDRKIKANKANLDKHIFQAWKENRPELRRLIGELRGAFNFRNHMAHGLLWDRGKYDFDFVYHLAIGVLNDFALQGLD